MAKIRIPMYIWFFLIIPREFIIKYENEIILIANEANNAGEQLANPPPALNTKHSNKNDITFMNI